MSDVRYCIRCQEILYNGPVPPRCSRCLQRYDPADPSTFRDRPMFIRWKFWLPGLLLAVVPGIATYVVLLTMAEGQKDRGEAALGLSVFFVLPFSCGALMGYFTPMAFAILSVLCVPAALLIVIGLIRCGASGIACGMLGVAVFIAPMIVGVASGVILRKALHCSRWDQRHFFPILALLALPYAAHGIERLFPRALDVATVRSEAVLPGDAAAAWRSIVFFEEVRHAPPFLLRLALPRPVRSEGKKTETGGIVRCVYERGHIVKQITDVREDRLLAFRVLEQKLHFEWDVTLLDGSFELFPAGGAATRVVLTTRYARHLYPEWLWGPIERKIVRTLHGHVLEGMRIETEGTAPTGPNLSSGSGTPIRGSEQNPGRGEPLPGA